MTTVIEALARGDRPPVFACDFTPPKSGDPQDLAIAASLDADFISVAYSPGKAVRVDSAAAAFEIKRTAGRDVIFNLAPRDMNKLALESRLLGAQLLGLENVLVVQGDPVGERDRMTAVTDYTASGLIGAIKRLNSGVDFKDAKLRAPTSFCIGASIDLGKGVEQEARLAQRKLAAGAVFFLSQPVFDVALIADFLAASESLAGAPFDRPVLWGLQILVKDGVLFSNVPDDLRRDLANGRDGVDIALESYARLREAGIRDAYVVAPILRGGARDYEAARRFLMEVRDVT